MTNLMLQLKDNEPPLRDNSERQGRSCSHRSAEVAATVAKEVAHQLPASTRICQTRPLAKTSEGSGSRTVDDQKTIIRKKLRKIKKHHDVDFLHGCTAIESTSAVKADVRTRSFKGGWRRRYWGSTRERIYSRTKTTQTMDSTGLGESQDTSSAAPCQTETVEQLDGKGKTPSIVFLTPQDGASTKEEQTTTFQQTSSVCETSSVDQSEWEHAESSQDFDDLNLSDVSQWDILSSYGGTEMESCEDETQIISESELSDASDMESDSYWEWNRERRQFQHYDEERQIYIYCPRQFL